MNTTWSYGTLQLAGLYFKVCKFKVNPRNGMYEICPLTVFSREHKVESTTFLSPQVTIYVNALAPLIGKISIVRASAAPRPVVS